MIAFNEGWEPHPLMSNRDAKEILMSILGADKLSAPIESNPFSPPAPPASSIQSQHIAQYIEYMMIESGYSSLNITIEKDPWGTLVFNINKKEK